MLTVATLILSTLAACSDGGEISDADRLAGIEALGRSVVEQRGVPGMAAAVLRDGESFSTVLLGRADGAGTPVDSSTPFQLASTTKIFGSTAVLLLVDDGRIALDDPIGQHLDDLPQSWREVTIQQLLSHTSGLPDISIPNSGVELVADNWDDALRQTRSAPLLFEPGHAWAYNQTNYALLQRVVEAKSGKPLAEFLAARIFRPLGMADTFYPDDERRCATNFERDEKGKIVERSTLRFPPYVRAAGGLCASLDDLKEWSAALDAGKILSRDLQELAWTPALLANGSIARVSGSMAYGLGWVIDTTPGHRWVGHSGGNSSAYRRYLDDKLTVIMLHNGNSDPEAIANALGLQMLAKNDGVANQAKLWDGASGGDIADMKAALAAGADIGALDTRSSRNGRYALNWAALNDRVEAIDFLLRNGAEIDAANTTGFTALHHAAEEGSLDAAKALLAAGADTTLRTAAGETAADVARRKGHPKIARLIDSANSS